MPINPDMPAQAQPPAPSAPDTQTYLDAISKIKEAGGTLPSVDWSALPGNVDKRQIVSAYIDGLPQPHADFVNKMAMAGQKLPQLNLSKVPGYTPPPARAGSDLMQGSIYQDYPKTRFVMQKIVRPVVEMAGQALGGTAGAALGTPEAPGVGTATLGMVGATAGGTAADELMNKADVIAGLAHPETQLPGSVDTTGSRIGKEALTNAAMVGGGKLAGKFASELDAPFASSVNPEVQSAAKALDVPLTAAQQSNSKLLSQAEQMAAKLPGSAGIMGDFYAKTRSRMMAVANSLFQNKNMNPQIAKEVGDSINSKLMQKTQDLAQSGITPQLDPADVGNSVATDISNFTKQAMQKSSAAFNALKGNETAVPLESTAQQAQKLLAQHQALPPGAQDKRLVSILQDLSGSGGGDLGDLMTNPTPDALAKMKAAGIDTGGGIPSKSIPDIMNIRSTLGSLAAQHEGAFATNQPGTKFMGNPISGAYKSLVGSLDKDLGNVQSGGFSQAYQAARANHAAMTSVMENPYIKNILSEDQPENIVNLAVRKGDVSNLAQLQKMVTPQTYQQIGNAFKNKLIENSQNADGQFIPMKLAQQIKAYGEPTIAQAVGPDGLANLKKLSTISDGSFSDPEFRNFISDLGRKNGENVSGMLMGASPANINRVRMLIGEPAFQEAQDGFIHNLLTNNQDNIDFAGLAKRMGQIPPDSLATAIPPEKLQILNHLSTIGKGIASSQREFSNPSGTAPMMGMFYILRQLFNAPMKAAQVLGGLAGGTEAYLTKPVTKYLTQGAANPATVEAVGSTAAKVPISIFGNSLSNPYKNRQK
jgi:hypothetical protein